MKKLRYILLLLAAIVCGSIYAQKSQKELEQLMRERGEYYFSLTVQKSSDIQAISDICSVDGSDGKTVIAYSNQKEYDRLIQQGYQPTLLTPPSLRETPVMYDASRGTYDWDSYLTYEQYEDMMQDFAFEHPDRCTYLELGTLASGRKMMGVRLGNGSPDGKVKFLYTSTMHGDEVTGMILMLRLIDEFCTSNDARILNILNNVDLFIFPNTNPDGTYHSGNHTVSGATRNNGNDVDLNRHFPDFDDGPHPDDADHYEDECQWMMDLAQEHLFTMSANYHGGAEVLNYPWDTYQPRHADNDWWKLVCHEYADLCHEWDYNYMNMPHQNAENGIINGYVWYTITGSRQDYMNYYAQCREVTIECSNDKTPSASRLPNFWDYNHNSMLTFIEQATKGVQGIVTDSITSEPISGAMITVCGHDHHGSQVSTHALGDFYRPIKGGDYTFAISKEGYCTKLVDVTIADGETLHLDIQLSPGYCMIPLFNASATEIPLRQSVDFTDNSFGEIASWSWEFEGGTPATSAQQNPTGIVYNESGDFDVTLTVTDVYGNSETLTHNDFIHVLPYEAYNMHSGNIETCNAYFYDDGGPDDNYSDSKNYTLTFKPGIEGNKIRVEFLVFNTEEGYDFLYIYDGSSTNATLIGKYDGINSPGTVTASNSQGALTFRFHSDRGINDLGWEAHVSCYDSQSVNEAEERPLIYPNPNQGSFSIKAQGEMEYQLCNSLGQRVLSGHFSDETQIDAKQLSQGIYFLQLTGEQGIHVEKIVVEK